MMKARRFIGNMVDGGCWVFNRAMGWGQFLEWELGKAWEEYGAPWRLEEQGTIVFAAEGRRDRG
jgi:hypothetical protein